MATTVTLAAGTTAATSSNMVIPAGTSALIGLSVTAPAVLHEGTPIVLRSSTNADPTAFVSLNASNPCVLVTAPSTDALTVVAVRPAMPTVMDSSGGRVNYATGVYIIQ